MIRKTKRFFISAFCVALSHMTIAQNLSVQSGQTLTISNQSLIYQDVTIESGGQLFVYDATLKMLSDGRVTVKPGGRLLLSKANVISATSSYWEGILVEGNPSLSQTPSSNQGYTNIINSTISGAKIAISTKSLNAQGNINWGNSGGGIIVMTKSSIKNCKSKHVEFFSYKNRSGGKEINNLSKFVECFFSQTNIKYPIKQVNASSNPQVLSDYSTPFIITVWGVKGVAFRGCNFYGNHPVNNLDPHDYQKAFHSPSGILAFDASIIVEDVKPFTGNNSVSKPSKFSGLNVAIANYYSSINEYLCNINNCIFINVEVGISHNGGTGSVIYRNTFWLDEYLSTMPYQGTNISFPGRKIITDNATGLKIAENKFERNPIGNNPNLAVFSTHYATVINNSDRGIVNSLTPASRYIMNSNLYGLNTLQTQKDNLKLLVTCNKFNGGGFGWAANGQMNFNPLTTTSKIPTFGNCISEPVDYNNLFGNLQPNQTEIYNYSTSTPTLAYVVKPNELYRPAANKCLNMNVNNCQSNPVSVMPCSSNLPIEPGWFPPSFDFNPNIFIKIKDSIHIYKTILADSTLTPLQKENAEAHLTHNLKQGAAMLADKINYHQYMNLFDDESEEHLDELITFLSGEDGLFAKMMLIGIHINHGNLSDAQTLLDGITETDANTMAYRDLCNILIGVQAEGRNIFMLTETEYNTIYNIAYGETTSATDAQGILALITGDVLSKHVEIYPGVDSINVAVNQYLDAHNSFVTLYPNPAIGGDIVTASYKVSQIDDNTKIMVYDYMGNLITQTPIIGSDLKGEVMINTTDLEMGLYIVRLFVNNQVVATSILSYLN